MEKRAVFAVVLVAVLALGACGTASQPPAVSPTAVTQAPVKPAAAGDFQVPPGPAAGARPVESAPPVAGGAPAIPPMVPGPVRECLEQALGSDAKRQIEQGQRSPTAQEQTSIDRCVSEGKPPAGQAPAGQPAAGSTAPGAGAAPASAKLDTSQFSGPMRECVAAQIGEDASSQLLRGQRAPTKAEQDAVDVCLAWVSPPGKPATLDWPAGPLPKTSVALRVKGEPPCGWEAGRAALEQTYPVLVRYLGEPFSLGTTGVTWVYDSGPLDLSKGGPFFPETDEIVLNGRPAGEQCEVLWWAYFHELGHLFYDVGQSTLAFQFGQWAWEAHSLVAQSFAETETREARDWGTSTLSTYDIQANVGWEKVNGVGRDGAKYGDDKGSLGRSTVDSTATAALRLMTEVLSHDTGLDYLKRVNAGLLAEYQASRNVGITAEQYKGILNKAAQGRTVDGRTPGDWMFAQPVANTKGSPGAHLSIRPGPLVGPGDELHATIAAYERQAVGTRDDRQETPLGDLEVAVSVVDASGQVRAQATARTRPNGDGSVRVPLPPGLAASAYLVEARASAKGQALEANNFFTVGRDAWGLNRALVDIMLVVPLNADGRKLRPEVVSQLQVKGAEKVETPVPWPGVLVLKANPGASVELTQGSFRAVISKPLSARIVPIRVP